MAVLTARISPSQANDLAIACSVGERKLDLIRGSIEAEPTTIRQSRLTEIIRSFLPPAEAEAISRLVFGISSSASRDVEQVSSLLSAITQSIKTNFTGDKRFINWAECSRALKNLILADSVMLSAKAIDVAYDFERVLSDARILTTIRPIFNEQREVIVGTTIVNTLRIEFFSPSSAGEQNNISLALDIADIKKIKKLCEDALRKAEVAKADIAEKWNLEAIMAGEDEE